MASLDIAKLTTAGAKSLAFNHFEGRDKKHHSNEDINPELTDKNYFIGCVSASEMVRKGIERVAEVDALHPNHTKRKDRVTFCSLEAPCPLELTKNGKSDEFFQKTYDFLCSEFGKENVCGLTVHKDEVHKYKDHGQTRTSLEHAHAYFVPYTAENGIHGSKCIYRERLFDLQKRFNDMVRAEFGIDYNTHSEARKRSVESLKLDSLAESIKEQENVLNGLVETVQRYQKLVLDTEKDSQALLEQIGKKKILSKDYTVSAEQLDIVLKELLVGIDVLKAQQTDLKAISETKEKINKTWNEVESMSIAHAQWLNKSNDIIDRIVNSPKFQDGLNKADREYLGLSQDIEKAKEIIKQDPYKKFKQEKGVEH